MQVGGFSDYPHGFEDWSLWAKCWKAGAQIVQVRQAIYYAYVNPLSKMRLAWRDRTQQAATHERIQRELWPGEPIIPRRDALREQRRRTRR